MTISTQTQLRKRDNELGLQKTSQFEGGDDGGVGCPVGLRAIQWCVDEIIFQSSCMLQVPL